MIRTILLTGLWLALAAPPPEEQTIAVGEYQLRILRSSLTGNLATLEISARQASRVRVDLSPMAREIQTVFAAPQGRLLAFASRWDPAPLADTLAVIDPGSGSVLDVVRGRFLTPSPDHKLVAFYYRAGRPTCLGYEWGAVLVYDVAAAAGRGSADRPGTFSSDELALRRQGTIVYPEQHRIHGQYFLALSSEKGYVFDDLPRHGTDFLEWSPDSTRLAVVEQEDQETRIVVIDVSRGVHDPVIHQIPLPLEPFLNPEYGSEKFPPDPRADYRLTVKSLRFAEDGRGVEVTSWPTAKFLERTVVLAVPPPVGMKE